LQSPAELNAEEPDTHIPDLPKRKLFLLLHYLSPLNHTSQTKQADPGWWMEQSVNNHKFGKPDYIQPTPAS